MDKKKKQKVTISLNEDVLIEAKKWAIDERINLSALIEELLRDYLDITKNK